MACHTDGDDTYECQMDRAYVTCMSHAGAKANVYWVSLENMEERESLEVLGVVGRIILNGS